MREKKGEEGEKRGGVRREKRRVRREEGAEW